MQLKTQPFIRLEDRISFGLQTGQISSQVPNVSNIPQHEETELKLDKQFMLISGKAGSGKTFLIKKKAEEDPKYIQLCATTGIAAINLGTRTLNSVLGYYNTKSLFQNFQDGKLAWKLRELRESYRVLGIDEASMLPASQLDLIYDMVYEINQDKNPKKLGIHLVADFCQLPPVKKPPENEEFCFKANCWPEFEKNTIKLSKIWRQDNQLFVTAINAVRMGDAKNAVTLLKECGVKFIPELIQNFAGTTIISINKEVDAFNDFRLKKLVGELIRVVPKREGESMKEWDTLIPNEMRFKIGALVMLLANDIVNWEFVNGDLCNIISYNKTEDSFLVKLLRNGKEVIIKRIKRFNMRAKAPDSWHFTKTFSPTNDFKTGEWIIGTISFHPMRIAYATSCHKSQGLSLDLVQIDTRQQFFGSPSMAYVAISRARTPEKLIIVGSEEMLARRINTSKEVQKYV